jgi:hypothetical protein
LSNGERGTAELGCGRTRSGLEGRYVKCVVASHANGRRGVLA